jgi:hypothetical protein
LSRGGAILASLLATIGRPAWWLVALAGFLVRGGFVVFVLPIVLLPSPLAISNVLAPVIVPVALGRIEPEAIALFLGTVAVLSGWIFVGGWIAAATELVLIREEAVAAAEEGVGAPRTSDSAAPQGAPAFGSSDRVLVRRVLAARLVAWLPLAIAIAIGIVGIISITYAELTRPAGVGTPLVLRVAIDAAPELAIIGVTWVLGELVGGLAARRIVLDGAATRSALRAAAGEVVRRPGSTLLPWLVTTGLLVAVLVGSVLAASIAWSRVIVALSDRNVDPATLVLNLLSFVAIWLAALVLTGLFAAARGAVETFEYVQRRSTTGTFGASAHRRPGDWSIPGEGGSL